MHPDQLTLDKHSFANNAKKPFETLYQQRIRLNQQMRQAQLENMRQKSPMLEIRPTKLFPRQLTPVTGELSNIKELLKDEVCPEADLSDFFDKNPHQEDLKSPLEEFQTSFANSFYQKRAVSKQGERIKSASMNTTQAPPSRGGSKRQKLVLKLSDQCPPFFRSLSGKAFNLFQNNLFEVKGRRVSMQDQTTMKMTQQKSYLRNLKQDPLSFYQSQGKDSEQNTINLSQLLNSKASTLATKPSMNRSMSTDKKSLLYKSMSSFLNQENPLNNSMVHSNFHENTTHEGENKSKIRAFLLDGNNVKPTKKQPHLLSHNKSLIKKQTKVSSLATSLVNLRASEAKLFL